MFLKCMSLNGYIIATGLWNQISNIGLIYSYQYHIHFTVQKQSYEMEMPGIEPGAFHMQSERSTTEPRPLHFQTKTAYIIKLSCLAVMSTNFHRF